MNIKKIIAVIASTALTATLLASCGSSSSGKTAKKDTKDGKELSVLRVANMTGQPDQYADYIGMEQGIFEKYGISLETSEYAAGILIWLTCHVRNSQNAKLFTVFGNLLCGFSAR